MGKQHAAPRLDRGATGQAMAARPRHTIETIEAGVTVDQMGDTDPLDAIRLTALQRDAAAYLRDLWRDALPAVEMPNGYGNGAGHGGQRHLTHDQQLAAARAWQDYRRAMDGLGNYSQRDAASVRRAVIDAEPAHRLDVAHGLAWLARHWRMT